MKGLIASERNESMWLGIGPTGPARRASALVTRLAVFRGLDAKNAPQKVAVRLKNRFASELIINGFN